MDKRNQNQFFYFLYSEKRQSVELDRTFFIKNQSYHLTNHTKGAILTM